MYMNAYTSTSPATVSDTRKHLTGHVARFRREGVDADPVVFGDHRRPEAVLLPFETFELLLEAAEDIVLAQRVRERAASDDGTRVTLSEAATRFGLDLDRL
jgi:PHD/YefM family antitoxin component YafN of YafNO toxin-antitoxin module